MEDYEKFDRLLENIGEPTAGDDPELDSMVRLVKAMKLSQPHPSAVAQTKSQRRMLDASKAVAQSSRRRRISLIGSLYAWAVPAILLLAIGGVVYGNSGRDPVNPNPAVGDPETQQGAPAGILSTVEPTHTAMVEATEFAPEITMTTTMTPTINILTTIASSDGPAADQVPGDLIPTPVPGEAVPDFKLPGANIEPPDGSDGSGMVTPRPGDGREGGRNPDS